MKFIKKYKYFLLENVNVEMPLPNDIIKIAKLYHDNGKDLFVVGGSVRDFLQGKTPHDYDLVTNALPEESKKILKTMNVSDEQGKKFGVLRIYTKYEPLGYEVASYRKDISGGRDNKGENQKVEMGHHLTIEDDCLRRDFTMNSLYYDINKKKIIDLVGGIEDIKNGIIRAVGEPSERFSEDRLRLLRACRFASRGSFKIDKKTSKAIIKDKRLRNISTVDDVSQERIVEEFIKAVDWSSEHKNLESLKYYLELLDKYKMFEEMFPELDIDINNINTFSLIVIFALLFRNNNIDILRSKLREYKFPGDIADPACFLLRLKENLHNLDKIPALYKEKKRFHVDNETILEFAKLYNFNDNYLKAFLKFNPKIDSIEIMNQGFKGAEIGAEVKRKEIEEFKSLL
jgi:tRNA nucleotidyltransferase (CCA-adding enzyme)